MPHFDKKVLSQFIRTGCERQLKLNLTPTTAQHAAERERLDMPPKQPPRPGLEEFTQAGERWQEEKLTDLINTFGPDRVVGDRVRNDEGGWTFGRSGELRPLLDRAVPNQLLVEPIYDVGPTFERQHGLSELRQAFGLTYGRLRPDLVQVLPPGSRNMVQPDATVVWVPQGDQRLQLRIIDIKLTSEPSPSYLSEVVYYSAALAGWLADNGLEQRFLVSANSAVWPGSHEASELTRALHAATRAGQDPTVELLSAALERDLEIVPFEVFALRLRSFLRTELPYALATNWRDLEWHVDGRCRGCDYLGYPWQRADGTFNNDPRHCMPTAEALDHVSRIAFITRGATVALRERDVRHTAAIAALNPHDAVFGVHQALRATRTVVAGRARALTQEAGSIPEEAGTSAALPRWADLRISITVDFDISSAITFAFGIKAFFRNPDTAEFQQWPVRTFVVPERSTDAEQREFLQFLNYLNQILEQARQASNNSTFQIYLWDSLQSDHFARIIGRHLEAILSNLTISKLAWLFPSEELLENPDTSSRMSPITIIRDAVKALVAAPIPHYYSLLNVARRYHRVDMPEGVARFSVHPLFEDALSDQIPSERAHEIWAKSARPYWADQIDILRETVGKRLNALESIAQRLELDLRGRLAASAPRIRVGPPTPQTRLSTDGQLWYAFSKLNVAYGALEIHRTRAMPPHEREAKFRIARLIAKVEGQAETEIVAREGLQPAPGRLVYRLATESVDVRFREGDFNIALAPEADPLILDRTLSSVVRGTPLEGGFPVWLQFKPMDVALGVTLERIDRERHFVVLRLGQANVVNSLVAQGLLDLAQPMILDPVDNDFFTKRLLACLKAIGNPRVAQDSPVIRRALGLGAREAVRAATTPTAEMLWSPASVAATDPGLLSATAREVLENAGLSLNESQWTAWRDCLSNRVRLVWGPPGTGKTRTLINVVLGALLRARELPRPIRILVCAATYTAIDNVLTGVYRELPRVFGANHPRLRRIRSKNGSSNQVLPEAVDLPIDQRNPSAELINVSRSLQTRAAPEVVGAPPQQVYNLTTLAAADDPVREFFDLIVIDEATQMDVAQAILPLCALANGGSLVLAGDWLQLPPIHHAEPPLGLEDMVGSSYLYFRNIHNIPESTLQINYRSARDIVEFSRLADYSQELQPWSPNLALDLNPAIQAAPAGWPADFVWSDTLNEILDPQTRCVCVVYDDGRSSQSNRFEADLIAALAVALRQRLRSQLANERAPDGSVYPLSGALHSVGSFWSEAIGVVTPHRAQQALVTSRLRAAFGANADESELIREAVDTVERFQGQERDVILASLSLGDPDQIAQEDEFLQSLNRFNVMSSRARAKLIVLVSKQLVDHLSSDMDVLRESRLLKTFVESFCNHAVERGLTYLQDGLPTTVTVLLKSHRTD